MNTLINCYWQIKRTLCIPCLHPFVFWWNWNLIIKKRQNTLEISQSWLEPKGLQKQQLTWIHQNITFRNQNTRRRNRTKSTTVIKLEVLNLSILDKRRRGRGGDRKVLKGVVRCLAFFARKSAHLFFLLEILRSLLSSKQKRRCLQFESKIAKGWNSFTVIWSLNKFKNVQIISFDFNPFNFQLNNSL